MSVLTPSTHHHPTSSVKTWTVDAFRQLPEGPPFYELEDGKLIEMAQPTILHQMLLAYLMRIIGNYLAEKPLGQLFLEVEVQLLDSIIYVPDFCYVANDNDGLFIGKRALEGSPDLVVEILSPSTRNRDRSKKFRVYEAQGIQHYWIVDPYDKLIWVYENSALGFLTKHIIEPGEAFSPAIFPGLSIDLTSVWGELNEEKKEIESNE